MSEVPQVWYFYNLKQSIDDPHKSYNETTLASLSCRFDNSPEPIDENALYSQTTLRRTISPVTQWIPFNPSDAKQIREQALVNPSKPVPVGHHRLMFEVVNENSLRPIYWSMFYTTKVARCHWVFNTLTPIDPEWDKVIFPEYQKFYADKTEYTKVLEGSVNSPSEILSIASRVELMQSGKSLSVDLLFSPMNSDVYIYKADSSYIATKSTAEALLAGREPRGVLTVLKKFSFEEYKRMHQLPSRKSDNEDYKPMPINNLVLVFHGVGQKLSDSYSRINFVYAIDKLRVEVQHASEAPDVHQHFPESKMDSVRTLVLAVNWRSVFDAEAKVNVSRITVPSLGTVRQAFSDALLDIPLYMSENRRPDMLAAAASEANRLYNLVLEHHPSFAKDGRTHIIGHSLGSLITADLLTHQPSYLTEENLKSAPLKFQTTNYFTTGSMLGVFMLLKGSTLLARREYDKHEGGKHAAQTCSERPFGCFAVKNVYNIINPSDLLSYLVNATVSGAQGPEAQHLVGASGKPLEMDVLPSPSVVSKQTTPETSQLKRESSSTSSLTKFFTGSFFSKTEPEQQVELETEREEEAPKEVKEVLEKFKSLNENGQIDWLIPQSVGYMPSQYLRMFTAHFDYWSNRELARFLAIECGRVPGEEHTVPEHRVKWVYKKDIPSDSQA